jgi:hypothetical protein
MEGDGLPSPFAGPLARGWGKPYPYTTWVRSGGLQEYMDVRMWKASQQRFRATRAPRSENLPNCAMWLLGGLAGGHEFVLA